jgi:threonine synthase
MAHRGSPRAKRVSLKCERCATNYGAEFRIRCESCQGPVDVFYDLNSVRIGAADLPAVYRYADLLPIQDPAALPWSGEGDTPLVHARDLGRRVGLEQLYLKVEGRNPTRSTKDRMANVALAFLRERGVRAITVSSTGNSSTSFGAIAHRFPEVRLEIFCGNDFLDRLNFRKPPNVTVRQVAGSFVAAGRAAQAYARSHAMDFEGGFFNAARREGLKLAYLEAIDQMPVEPAVVVQAISSGMGLYGAAKGIAEYCALGRLGLKPRLVAAQQARCAPMYQGWIDGQSELDDRYRLAHPDGIAKAILRGDASPTYPHMRRVVADSGGCFTAVTDQEICQARALGADLEGVEMCNASAVALASAIDLRVRDWIAPDEPVLVNLTGADRLVKDVPTALAHDG